MKKKDTSHFIGGAFLCEDAIEHPAEYWSPHCVSFIHQAVAEHVESLAHMMVLVQDREVEVFNPGHAAGILHILKRPLKAVEMMIMGLEKPNQAEIAGSGTRIILGIGDLKYCMAVLHLAATNPACNQSDFMHLMRGLLDRKHGEVVWWSSREPKDLFYKNMGEMYLEATASLQRATR